MLSNPSSLLLRSPDLLTAQRILVVNFVQDSFAAQLRALNPNAEISLFSYNFADGEFARQHSDCHVEVAPFIASNEYDLVIYYYPKAKAEALMTLDNIRALVHQNSKLLVVGEKKGGVKSIEKQLQNLAQGHKVDAARHCMLYFYDSLSIAANFDINDYLHTFTLTHQVAQTSYSCKIASLPGVFNHGKLDDGTALLLTHLPNLSAKKSLLDFGCGAGVISAFAAKAYPNLTPHCIDVNALAVYATQKTLALNHIDGDCWLSDGLSEVKNRYDVILSNPPFHTGLKTDYTIAERFFASAKQHLHKHGELTLVANSFLAYPERLTQHFNSHHTLIKTKRFALYQNKMV